MYIYIYIYIYIYTYVLIVAGLLFQFPHDMFSFSLLIGHCFILFFLFLYISKIILFHCLCIYD